MSQNIQAIYEDGVLKPLSPLDLKEHERVQVSVSPITQANPAWLDIEFKGSCAQHVKNAPSLEQVRQILASVAGTFADDIRRERDEC